MQRSHPFGLVANGAPDDEIRKALTPAITEPLETALEAVMAAEAPASEVQIMAAIGRVLALLGQDWAPARREEFIAVAYSVLAHYPGGLLLDALERALPRVTIGRMLVNWVVEDVEPKADRLRIERERLVRLAQIAGSSD